MAWRPVVGGILGVALWWFLFFAIGICIGMLWPEYREAARMMFEEGDLSLFVTPMLFANFFLFVVAGVAVGVVATLVGRTRTTALVLTALFFLFMAINHYILEWEQLPPWYNVIVPVVIAGSIWLGSRIINLHERTIEHAARASAGRLQF